MGPLETATVQQGGLGVLPPEARADWGQRVGATVVDGIIIAAAVIGIGLLSSLVAEEKQGPVALMLMLVVSVTYYAGLLARLGPRNGQTLGKQVFKIRVVRQDGRPIMWGRALVREIGGKMALGALLGPLWLVNYLWPLWDKRNQALHDKLVSTEVLRAEQEVFGAGRDYRA